MTTEELRGRIQENERVSRVVRQRIHQTQGPARDHAWRDKRLIGAETRYYLLALAFLRQRLYACVERRTRKAITTAALAALCEVSEPEIKAWIAPPPAQEVAA